MGLKRMLNRRSSFLAFATLSIVVIWLMLGWHTQISNYLEREDYKELIHKEVNEHKNTKHNNNQIKNEPVIAIRKPRTGLSAIGSHFKLDGSDITILSGAIHYFRVPHAYWKDRLMKMKACGLNTIETYIPWNMHEPRKDDFNFSGELDIEAFIKLASDLGMFVILRPGPYICAEWELGGLPSWLLRDPTMSVRSMYKPYIWRVEKYFNKLLPILVKHQYTSGGNVIAFQIENEYGSFYKDKSYIDYLKKLMQDLGVKELLFTSDNSEGIEKPMSDGVLRTVNFQSIDTHLESLAKVQNDVPMMVMEFWSGWFDTWNDKHHTLADNEFAETVHQLLERNVSINFYMFHGGTNFGFMNGGAMQDGKYTSDITSYDYNAPLSESGELTKKYFIVRKAIEHYLRRKPDLTIEKNAIPSTSFENVNMLQSASIWKATTLMKSFIVDKTSLNMESFPINNDNGQSYGYALYSTKLNLDKNKTAFSFTGFANVSDHVQIFTNEVCKREMFIEKPNKWHLEMGPDDKKSIKFDLLVENAGRINWKDLDNQRKGILKPISIDGKEIAEWSIYALEMDMKFISDLSSSNLWSQNETEKVPSFYRGYLTVSNSGMDTFVHMKGWTKGVVFVNGQNLGRYWQIGPQCTLYLPAPWLKAGKNEIILFEEVKPGTTISFVNKPIWGTPTCS